MATRGSPTLDEHLDLILDAAQAHGEDDDPEQEVGDLQGIIHVMWALLSDKQKAAVVTSDEACSLLEDWGSP